MTKEIQGKALHDIHKVVFYVSEFPDKGLQEIAALFQQMGPFDFNAACWRAQDMGLLKIDKEAGKIEVLKTPEKWEFGEIVDHLIDTTPYILGKLADLEADLEENFFANYVVGYSGLDVMITVQYLKSHKIISTYEIKDKSEAEDGTPQEDVYTFYTLSENIDKRWGEKQFKDETKLER